jgi:predicted ATP-dependent serine protease
MPFIAADQEVGARVDWLWEGRLPSGQLAILDGDPGIGKSLMLLDLCARITTGRAFPGLTGERAATVR